MGGRPQTVAVTEDEVRKVRRRAAATTTRRPLAIEPAGAGAPLVLESKLAVPALRRGCLRRPALVARLRELTERRVTLVAAPAGFGKTTLLADWLAEDAPAVCWVSLDEADNDPLGLWAHIAAAVGRVVPGAAADLFSDVSIESALSTVVVPRLLNALASAELVVVLDDYHVVTAERCHESLSFFVDHLPPGVHVVVSTRREPALPLGRLRATAELGEIRAGDLRFDADEARALLVDSLGLGLTDADVARLHEKTEGWPAALYLAALSLQDASDPHRFVEHFAGSNRHIADYVTAEVLGVTDEPTRDFLLQTSVLDELSGPLCDAVLGATRSSERLHDLERSNLFVVALDEDRVWYRYHPLLAGLLRFTLDERAPELREELHARASAWFEEHDRPELAVQHALASSPALGAELVARHWRELACRRGAVRVVRAWFDEVPEAVVLAEPALALVRALVECQLGSPVESAEVWLAAAEQESPSTLPLPLGTCSPAVEAAVVRAMFAAGDVEQALSAAQAVHSRAADASPEARATAETALAYWLLLAGREHEALPLAKHALHMPVSATIPLRWAIQHAVASLAAAGLGDDLAADVFAERALTIVQESRHLETPRAALVWIARGAMSIRAGDADEARSALAQALGLAALPALVLERALALLTLASLPRDTAGPDRTEPLEEAARLLENVDDAGVLVALLGASGTRSRGGRRRPEDDISEAELRVLRLLPTRLTQREIGRELYLSFNTVKTHSRALYRKLGADGRRDAVVRARERRLI